MVGELSEDGNYIWSGSEWSSVDTHTPSEDSPPGSSEVQKLKSQQEILTGLRLLVIFWGIVFLALSTMLILSILSFPTGSDLDGDGIPDKYDSDVDHNDPINDYWISQPSWYEDLNFSNMLMKLPIMLIIIPAFIHYFSLSKIFNGSKKHFKILNETQRL